MENISILKRERKLSKSLAYQISDIKIPQIAAFILCFAFSRANLFGVIRPFSTAFYVSLGFCGVSKIISIFAITVANALFTNFYETIRQILALILFEILSHALFNIGGKKETLYTKSILMTFIIGFTGLMRGIVQGFHLYDFVVSLLSALLVFSFSIIISPASISFNQKKQGIIYDSKTVFSKAILLSVAIISLDGVAIWNCELGTVLAGIAIIMIARRKGSATGAMTGAVLGLVIALFDFPGSLELPGMFALAGATAGIPVKTRTSSVTLWTLVIILFSGLSVLDGGLTVKYYEALASGIIFLLLPNSFVNYLSDELAGLKKAENPELYETGNTHEASDKLFILGKSLSRVSRSIEESILEDEEDNNYVVQWIIEAVAEKVCNRCSMCDRCWNTYFFKTYKMVEDSLSDLKINESGQPEVPQWFKSTCTKPDKFLESLAMAHSIYKADKVWRQRLKESRLLLSRQAVVISAGIMSLARNLNDLSARDYELENRLLCVAGNKGIPVSGFRYHKGKDSKPYLEVLFEAKNKLNSKDLDDIILENVQNNLIRVGESRRDLMGYSVVRYMKKPKFKTVTGVARISKESNTISGDNFAFFITNKGYHISAISDGTGSGRQAEKYSRTAIQILESLIDDGIDINLAVRFLNLYLSMRGDNDRLATIDICAVDLTNGETSFYKYDAPPSIVKGKHTTTAIKMEGNDTEPMGISHYRSINLSGGDCVIMFSDGILETFSTTGETYGLESFIDGIDTINAQIMADTILKEAISRSDGKHDDMTVLVTKLW